jgi:hypothetical protein
VGPGGGGKERGSSGIARARPCEGDHVGQQVRPRGGTGDGGAVSSLRARLTD